MFVKNNTKRDSKY